MTEEQANKQAQAWWGKRGKAAYVPHRSAFGTQLPGRYVVGLTALPSFLGGGIIAYAGKSYRSFQDAFNDAVVNGNGPITGFENDEAIEDEA